MRNKWTLGRNVKLLEYKWGKLGNIIIRYMENYVRRK